MGANSFETTAFGKTANDAFATAKEQAYYDHGHSGYSGSIAEKDSFIVITLPEGKNPSDYASELMEVDDSRIEDKWGPAGCIKIEENKYLFFGWASS